MRKQNQPKTDLHEQISNMKAREQKEKMILARVNHQTMIVVRPDKAKERVAAFALNNGNQLTR